MDGRLEGSGLENLQQCRSSRPDALCDRGGAIERVGLSSGHDDSGTFRQGRSSNSRNLGGIARVVGAGRA